MDVPNKKRPLISKSFRLTDETLRKLELMGQAGKDVHSWVRELIEREIQAVFSCDQKLAERIQEIQNQAESA
jgi:predicted DNA-binding protein